MRHPKTQAREATRDRRIFKLLLIAFAAWGATYARFVIGPLQESVRGALSLSDNRMPRVATCGMQSWTLPCTELARCC